MFAGDVPLPRVFSFLSFKLIASDAPSGICVARGRRGVGRGETREDRGHGVRGELGCTRTASLSMPSRGEWCREVDLWVSVCVLHASEWWQVCSSLAKLIKVNPW